MGNKREEKRECGWFFLFSFFFFSPFADTNSQLSTLGDARRARGESSWWIRIAAFLRRAPRRRRLSFRINFVLGHLTHACVPHRSRKSLDQRRRTILGNCTTTTTTVDRNRLSIDLVERYETSRIENRQEGKKGGWEKGESWKGKLRFDIYDTRMFFGFRALVFIFFFFLPLFSSLLFFLFLFFYFFPSSFSFSWLLFSFFLNTNRSCRNGVAF